jgi:cell division protein FtsQ
VFREIPETISIRVSEHCPLAVLDMGRRFMLNTHGRIFKEYGPGDPGGLPLVTGIAYGDVSLGDDPLSPGMAAVVDALRISRVEGCVLPYDSIREIDVDTEMGITLYVWDGRKQIKLGLDGYKAKFKRIAKLLPHLKYNTRWRKFTAIDASNPDRIVVEL